MRSMRWMGRWGPVDFKVGLTLVKARFGRIYDAGG